MSVCEAGRRPSKSARRGRAPSETCRTRGLIDARVVALLAWIGSRHAIVVTSLRSDHSYLTVEGNPSNHDFGRAVDIGAADGERCTGTRTGACGRLAVALGRIQAFSTRPSSSSASIPTGRQATTGSLGQITATTCTLASTLERHAFGRVRRDSRASGAQVSPLQRPDRVALASLKAALQEARRAGERRPPFAILIDCLTELGVNRSPSGASSVSFDQAREEWLLQLRSARRSESTLAAYRVALDDLIAFLKRSGCPAADAFREETIVAYLDDYRQRATRAEATYYCRFALLRRFFRWFSRRVGRRTPSSTWKRPTSRRRRRTGSPRRSFARLFAAAGAPSRRRAGLAERDRLVLLTLVTTGLRRSELVALNWADLELNEIRSSVLVRRGKGGKPRRQPLPPALAQEFARLRISAQPRADAPVFCGLGGKRLQPTILANIIRRAADRLERGECKPV